jgi:hypothetical protein
MVLVQLQMTAAGNALQMFTAYGALFIAFPGIAPDNLARER